MNGGGRRRLDRVDERLQRLVGTWEIRAVFPTDPPGTTDAGQSTFEPTLGGAFLLERSVAPESFPDGLTIISPNEDGTFTQHYFDSRGVVRIYAMTFDGRDWTLTRTAPDFSPLNFHQRFRGRMADDGRTIDAVWETASDGVTWEQDFELVYTRVTPPA